MPRDGGRLQAGLDMDICQFPLYYGHGQHHRHQQPHRNPPSELTFRFSRSGGPGGQNVNKLETKVELLFDVARSAGLTDEQKQLVLTREKNRIDADGMLRVTSQESRSQFENREVAVEKFIAIIAGALAKRKKRLKFRVPKGSREKRIEGKKLRGKKKQMRGRVDF